MGLLTASAKALKPSKISGTWLIEPPPEVAEFVAQQLLLIKI